MWNFLCASEEWYQHTWVGSKLSVASSGYFIPNLFLSHLNHLKEILFHHGDSQALENFFQGGSVISILEGFENLTE